MKFRSLACSASALIGVVLLSACGASSGETSGGAGSTAAGAPANFAGGGSSAGGDLSGGAGTPTAGAPAAGAGGTAAGTGGSTTAGSGGSATAGSGGSSAGAGGSGGAAVGPIPDTKSVMYLPNWNGSFASWATKVDFKKMTHLLLAFGVSKGNDWSLGAQDADVKTLAAAAHAANVKVLVSIGGMADDLGICNQYHTASNIAPMVMNLDAMVTRMDLDGVDVDIERGNEMRTSGNFPQFLSKLETTLHGHGKLVTAATAQYIVQDSGTDAGVISYLKSYDFINLMIYAFESDMHQYTQQLAWWDSKIGMPKTKLTWGIEFDPKLSTDLATKITTASKAYGGIMVWEYSQGTQKTLWPAVQGAL